MNTDEMKARTSFGFFLLLAVLIAGGGAGLAAQWRQTTTLRTELEMAWMEAGDLHRLRAENQRLRGRQISVAELELLRADHAALPRLRKELETLGKSAEAPR